MLGSDPHGPLVSVVIPCLNEAAHLPSLLDALYGQEAPLHEVIVVDNRSTDRSREIVREYQRRHPEWPLRLMTCPIPGVAAAMNVGIRAASGTTIVRLDGHCLPRADYVWRAVQTLQLEGAGVVGGVWEITPGHDTRVGRAIASALSHTLATGGAAYRHPGHAVTPTEVDTVPFGCYRKSLWEQLGGYPERLKVNEDYVFNYRARLAGWRVILDPAVQCLYFSRSTFGRLAAQYFQYGWWKADMLKAHPRSVRLRQILPAGLVAALVALALLGIFVRPAWQGLAAVLVVYTAILLLAGVHLASSRRTWSAIPLYVAAFAIVQLAWGAGACVNVATFGHWPRWTASQPRLGGSPSMSLAEVVGSTALGAFVFYVVQPYGTPDPLGLGPGSSWTALCYTFAIPVLVIQLARRVRISLTPFDYLLFAYVAVVLITWPTGYDRQAGLKAIGALLGQISVFYAVRSLLTDSLFPSHLIVTVLVVGIAVLQLMAIGSHLEHGLFNRLTEYSRPHAWGGRPEIGFLAAIELALLLGIRVRSRPRTFQLAFFGLVLSIVVELIFLYSRLAWIAACGALAVWGFVTLRAVGPRWRALALAGVALLAVSVFVRDPALSRVAESMVGAGQVQATPEMRIVLWRRTARMIRDHPLLGVGLGNFQAPFVSYYTPEDPNDDQRRGVHAHNLFLHQAAEVGVPGGLIYAALWSVGLFAGWKEARGAFYALIVVAVAGFGENMFLDSVFAPRARLHSVAWILLALIVAEWSRRRVARVGELGHAA